MSISPEAIQAISSRLSAIYVGSSIGSNVVDPVNTYNERPNSVTARSALIGGATIGLAVASITSTNIFLPYVGQIVGIGSLSNNLNEIIKGATQTGTVNTSNIIGAMSDATAVIGSISLTLAAEGTAIGVAGSVLAPALVAGAVLTVASIGLILEAQAAENDTIHTPEVKALSDAINQFISDFGDAAKLVTDAMMDPDFWDAFADKGAEVFAPLLDPLSGVGNWIGQSLPTYYEMKQSTNDIFNAATRWTWPRDPIILDLDGNGLETVGLASNIHFDHNGDGVMTKTGWVGKDDVLLVWDRNRNGTIDTGAELFGDFTPLPNGTLAPNGFAALAALDSNGDGVLDVSDPAFAELKLWRDADQNGITGQGELISLQDAGIVSLNLAHTLKNQRLTNGNTLAREGSFTRADGTSSAMGEFHFATDTFSTRFVETIEVPDELKTLPNLQASGKVRKLSARDGAYTAKMPGVIAGQDNLWRVAA